MVCVWLMCDEMSSMSSLWSVCNLPLKKVIVEEAEEVAATEISAPQNKRAAFKYTDASARFGTQLDSASVSLNF